MELRQCLWRRKVATLVVDGDFALATSDTTVTVALTQSVATTGP
jgi:hypothetical protein